jgi:serine/threonine protein kinase
MNHPASHTEPFLAIQPPRIEGYRITSLLGVGGMATVWRATHLPSGREVAIKLMDARAFPSRVALDRFNREVRLAAMLDHPLIARPHASGVSDGIHYYAMELIDGLPLDAYVRERKPSQADVLRLFSAICRAVHHAHQRGVIHRDLKPANILVDASGRPHLLDFGLAEAMGAGEHCALAAGEVAGTPAFMSPEQASPHPRPIDARSDVYTLGALLFLLLTGEAPHDTNGSCEIVLRRIRTVRPRRPREIAPRLDRRLESILLGTLEKDPALRPQSAAELADLIDDCIATPLPRKLAKSLGKRIRNPLGRNDKTRVLVLAMTAALAGPLRFLFH